MRMNTRKRKATVTMAERQGKKRCVIFDMDGCLIDTERVYTSAWLAIFEEEGIPFERSAVLDFAGKGGQRLTQILIEMVGSEERLEALRRKRDDYFSAAMERGEVRLLPGAMEIVDYARAAGAAIGVATSSATAKGETLLKHFDLYDKLDFRVFGDMIPHLKPAPDIYLKAMELAGYPPAECIAFEDSCSGVQAAIAAHLDVIYVPGIGEPAPEGTPYYKKVPSLLEGRDVLAALL